MNSKLTGSITSSNSEARTSTGQQGWGEGEWDLPEGAPAGMSDADSFDACFEEGNAADLPDAPEPLPSFSPFELFARALPFWTRAELLAVAAILSIPTDR